MCASAPHPPQKLHQGHNSPLTDVVHICSQSLHEVNVGLRVKTRPHFPNHEREGVATPLATKAPLVKVAERPAHASLQWCSSWSRSMEPGGHRRPGVQRSWDACAHSFGHQLLKHQLWPRADCGCLKNAHRSCAGRTRSPTQTPVQNNKGRKGLSAKGVNVKCKKKCGLRG